MREYKKYYCGLCRTLAKRYGFTARFLLSYDTVFLLTVLCALGENKPTCALARCPYHFGKKRVCMTGELADYAADATVLLAYLNFEDDIADDVSLKSRIPAKLYRNAFEKAKAARPELYVKIRDTLNELADTEKRDERNPDIPANIFGRLLGDVFAYDTCAYQFGYTLGRFIYLCDAACDFKSDLKHGHYNPLISLHSVEFEGILALLLSECCAEYEKLNIQRSKEIIENVLYDGIWLKFNLKTARKVKKSDRPV